MRAPLFAANVIGNSPTGAESETENMKDWLIPGLREKEEPDVTSTPGGRPCKVTLMVPLNPFCGKAETEIGEVVLPITADAKIAERERLKSGAGGCELF